ncbi:melanoma-associated antigen 10-like [Perognathus longimembris pacificus]|uniref:melanoma-associated antigen 10-like n=1 Tax=Perognathus longimembris pacificus TaxID=214514 RepID=UPI002018DCAE|nr:melanoma-associated antigen 10-like [Perognathus longimembris pacificus]
MMPRKGRQGQDNPQDQREASQGVVSECPVPVAEVQQEGDEEVAAASSSSSATIPEVPVSGVPTVPRSPPRASSPPRALVSSLQNQFDQGSRCPQGNLGDPEALLRDALNAKVVNLVQFLLFKYQMKRSTTKAEILNRIIRRYRDYFPVIFRSALKCLQLVFGIDMKVLEPHNESYMLVTCLGLTYDGLQTDVQGVPKTGLLIMILGIIFMEGNYIPAEVFWEYMSMMGMDEEEHFICGNPRRLIGEDFVQEQYLEYRQVPNSDPARYEFLWGPRARLETSKMKILLFFSKISGSDPKSYPALYEEALREEEERQ